MGEPAMDDQCARCGKNWGEHFGPHCPDNGGCFLGPNPITTEEPAVKFRILGNGTLFKVQVSYRTLFRRREAWHTMQEIAKGASCDRIFRSEKDAQTFIDECRAYRQPYNVVKEPA